MAVHRSVTSSKLPSGTTVDVESGPMGTVLNYYDATDLLHRTDGQPAHIAVSPRRRTLGWYRYGLFHRTGGPSAVSASPQRGTLYTNWFRHGDAHRTDSASQINADGRIGWFTKGVPLVRAWDPRDDQR